VVVLEHLGGWDYPHHLPVVVQVPSFSVDVAFASAVGDYTHAGAVVVGTLDPDLERD